MRDECEKAPPPPSRGIVVNRHAFSMPAAGSQPPRNTTSSLPPAQVQQPQRRAYSAGRVKERALSSSDGETESNDVYFDEDPWLSQLSENTAKPGGQGRPPAATTLSEQSAVSDDSGHEETEEDDDDSFLIRELARIKQVPRRTHKDPPAQSAAASKNKESPKDCAPPSKGQAVFDKLLNEVGLEGVLSAISSLSTVIGTQKTPKGATATAQAPPTTAPGLELHQRHHATLLEHQRLITTQQKLIDDQGRRIQNLEDTVKALHLTVAQWQQQRITTTTPTREPSAGLPPENAPLNLPVPNPEQPSRRIYVEALPIEPPLLMSPMNDFTRINYSKVAAGESRTRSSSLLQVRKVNAPSGASVPNPQGLNHSNTSPPRRVSTQPKPYHQH